MSDDDQAPGAGKASGGTVALDGINVESGTTPEGKPFLHVTATSATGQVMRGQLSPDEVRALALSWLTAAEAADQDAALIRTLLKLELPLELAAHVVAELRQVRGRVG